MRILFFVPFSAQFFEGRFGANQGLKFNLGFFFFYRKAFSRIIFSILYRASIIKL